MRADDPAGRGTTDRKRRQARLTLVLLALVFVMPMAAAYLWHLWGPAGESASYGTLIEPPRPLKRFEMTGLDGGPAGLEVLKGKWTLLYVGGGRCGDRCREKLYNIERVRLTQGKHMDRVQSLYLAPESVEGRMVADTLVEYQGVQGYRISRKELEGMAPGFEWRGDSGEYGRIYVVDPIGNLMMFYPEGADPSGMKEDLERLLKVSQIG